MRQRQFSDLFALFFEPRVPALFLVGSVVLAVLGNAVYDLIVAMIGATSQTFVMLIVSTTIIFFFVLQGFRAVLRIVERRRPLPDLVPEPSRAEPHAGLMLLVSSNPAAPELDIVAWHRQSNQLRHCWLVTSPEAEARAADLTYRLSEVNVRVHRLAIADVNDVQQTYAAVLDGLRAAPRLLPDASMIVDITGGTKPMTVGALLACLDAQASIEYLVPARRPDGTPDLRARPVPMRIEFEATMREDTRANNTA